MQLPHDLQHFSTLTLLVLADTMEAKFWLLGGDTAEEIDALLVPRERKTDDETSFVNVDTGAGSSPENSDQERGHEFVREVASAIERLLKKTEATSIALAMPAEIAHALPEHLSKPTAQLIGHQVHGEFMKESLEQILRRLHTLPE